MFKVTDFKISDKCHKCHAIIDKSEILRADSKQFVEEKKNWSIPQELEQHHFPLSADEAFIFDPVWRVRVLMKITETSASPGLVIVEKKRVFKCPNCGAEIGYRKSELQNCFPTPEMGSKSYWKRRYPKAKIIGLLTKEQIIKKQRELRKFNKIYATLSEKQKQVVTDMQIRGERITLSALQRIRKFVG